MISGYFLTAYGRYHISRGILSGVSKFRHLITRSREVMLIIYDSLYFIESVYALYYNRYK